MADLDTNPDDVALVGDGDGDKGGAPDTTTTQPADAGDKAQKAGDAGKESKPDAKSARATTVLDAKTDTKVADWPEDWREKVAGGDAKVASRLSRYASPKALADALINAQNKLASTRPVLGKNATEDEIKEYREALGIPESPEKYDLSAYKIEGNDKALIEGYLAKAHATHQTPEQVKAGIDAYFEIAGKIDQERIANDAQKIKDTEDELHAEWGREFRSNIERVNAFLDSAPEGLKERFFKGRLADGIPIGSDPATLRWLLSLELERNPTGVVVPGGGGDKQQTVDDELKAIDDFRRSNSKAYFKDEKMQARERTLLDYKNKQNEKGKRAA
jgi:hypothetical protein